MAQLEILMKCIFINDVASIYHHYLSGADLSVKLLSTAVESTRFGVDVNTIRLLLELGADARGNSTLKPIRFSRDPQIIALLIDYGADPLDADIHNLLTWMGCCYQAVATVAAHADINVLSPFELIYATNYFDYTLITFLFDLGINIDHQNRSSQTALMICCGKMQYIMAIYLVMRGAEVNIVDDNDETALFKLLDMRNCSWSTAITTESRVLWKLLVDKGATYRANKQGHMPRHAEVIAPTADEIDAVCKGVLCG